MATCLWWRGRLFYEQRTPAGKVEYTPVSYSRRPSLNDLLAPLTPGIRGVVLLTTATYLLLLVPPLHDLEGCLQLEPRAVLQGQVWRLVSYLLVHGPPMHLVFNMLSLWMFGSAVESQWGTRRFLGYYVGCGIAAGLGTLLTSSPTIGASGAVFGVLVAFAMLFPDMQVLFMGIFPLRAAAMVGLLVGIECLMFVGQMGGATAYICHLGGAAAGFLYIKYSWRMAVWWRSLRRPAASAPLAPRFTPPDPTRVARDFSRQQANRAAASFPQASPSPQSPAPPVRDAVRPRVAAEEIAMQQRADQILDKISREGMSSLSREERDVLNRHSQMLKSREGL